MVVGWEYRNGKKHLPLVFNIGDYVDYKRRQVSQVVALEKWNATDGDTKYHCRVCGRTMGEPNKGWDYRCYDCSDEED